MYAVKIDGEVYSTHDDAIEAWAFVYKHNLEAHGAVEVVEWTPVA